MFVKIGEENRTKIREKLRSSGKSVRVSGDARYNNRQSSASGPFEGATQSTFNLTEETTGKVIGLHNQNKLCTQATRLRHGGQEDIICPNHEGNCTATLLPSDSIGNEGKSLRKIAGDLKNDGIEISHFTSDGDASMIKALNETCKAAVWLRDSHHFQSAHAAKLKKITFSDAMFGHEQTKEWRENARIWFCNDLARRCTAEFTAAVNEVTKKTKDDSEIKKKLNSMLIDVPTAIIKCYQNDCSHCMHSLVCSGADDGRRYQAPTMTEGTCRNLTMTAQDEQKLRQGILVRLGPDAVEITYLNTNSQRNEAVNNAISKCNPKSLNLY